MRSLGAAGDLQQQRTAGLDLGRFDFGAAPSDRFSAAHVGRF
jgi:hypothetical protein